MARVSKCKSHMASSETGSGTEGMRVQKRVQPEFSDHPNTGNCISASILGRMIESRRAGARYGKGRPARDAPDSADRRVAGGSGGAAGQHLADTALGLGLVGAADGGDLAGQPVERGLVELAFGIGLLALLVVAVQVAHHLGDREQLAGIDLLLVFLGAARPHGALDAGLAL